MPRCPVGMTLSPLCVAVLLFFFVQGMDRAVVKEAAALVAAQREAQRSASAAAGDLGDAKATRRKKRRSLSFGRKKRAASRVL